MADFDDKEQKISIKFDTNAEETGKKIKKLDDTSQDFTKTQSKMASNSEKNVEALESLGGGFQSAIGSVKALGKQLLVLLANPVVAFLAAIVATLALVFKAFTSTKEGGEKLERILAGVGAVVDILRDRLLKLVSLDFKGAFLGFGDEVEREFTQAANAAKKLQEVTDAARNLSVSRAKLNRDLAENDRLINDANTSYAEKKRLLGEVEKAESKQTQAELANAKKKLAAISQQNRLSDSSKEALDAEAEARVKVYELEQKSAEDRKKILDFNRTLDDTEKSRLKEISDAKAAAYKERLAKQKEAQQKEKEALKKHNEELAALRKEQADAEKALLQFNQDLSDKTEEEKLARQKQRALEEIEIQRKKGIDVSNIIALNEEKFANLEDELREKRAKEKEEKEKEQFDKESAAKDEAYKQDLEAQKNKLEQERAIEDAKIGLLQQSVNLFNGIFGKSKKAQKAALIASNALGLAEVAINTQRAVAADVAVPLGAGLPKVPYDIASGALGAANIIAATAKGLKELGGGSAGTAAQTGTLTQGASAAPQVSFQSSSENQIANTLAGVQQDQPPIQAYVVAKDVTTAQALDRNKVNSNSF